MRKRDRIEKNHLGIEAVVEGVRKVRKGVISIMRMKFRGLGEWEGRVVNVRCVDIYGLNYLIWPDDAGFKKARNIKGK